MLIPDLPAGTLYQEQELEIKKSRFIARLYVVSSKEEVKARLDEVRAIYPDARHHCWAYVIAGGSSAAMSDDGEPSGTAGKPILSVLQHKRITDSLIVVSRYFGGIKLGAGGLVRAYSKSAQRVVDVTSFVSPRKKNYYDLSFDFAVEQQIRHWLSQIQGEVEQLQYQDRVCARVSLPEENCKGFLEQLHAASVEFSVVEQ